MQTRIYSNTLKTFEQEVVYNSILLLQVATRQSRLGSELLPRMAACLELLPAQNGLRGKPSVVKHMKRSPQMSNSKQTLAITVACVSRAMHFTQRHSGE